MVDTIRTLAALQALLADNTSGNISPQDIRDFLVSAYPQWEPYTPTWSVSSGTQPTIGNGSVTGQYAQHGSGAGSLVIATAKIAIGSTTTVGSGGYRVSLPVAVGTPDLFYNGTFLIVDSSDSNRPYPGICIAQQSGDWLLAQVANTGSGANINWSATGPITLASGDEIYLSIAYSAAA